MTDINVAMLDKSVEAEDLIRNIQNMAECLCSQLQDGALANRIGPNTVQQMVKIIGDIEGVMNKFFDMEADMFPELEFGEPVGTDPAAEHRRIREFAGYNPPML